MVFLSKMLRRGMMEDEYRKIKYGQAGSLWQQLIPKGLFKKHPQVALLFGVVGAGLLFAATSAVRCIYYNPDLQINRWKADPKRYDYYEDKRYCFLDKGFGRRARPPIFMRQNGDIVVTNDVWEWVDED